MPQTKRKRIKPKRLTVRWFARYGCGCTADARLRRELLEYCGQHGHDRKECFKMAVESKGPR